MLPLAAMTSSTAMIWLINTLRLLRLALGSRRTIGQIDAEGGAQSADGEGNQHCLAGIEALACQHIDS